MSEATFWNGEPCEADLVRVIVGDSEFFRNRVYWAREFVGQERNAVRVRYRYRTFYLDNEDGRGWWNVTTGRGSLKAGTRSLEVEREL